MHTQTHTCTHKCTHTHTHMHTRTHTFTTRSSMCVLHRTKFGCSVTSSWSVATLASDSHAAELEFKNNKLDEDNEELRQLMSNNERRINELKASATTSSNLAEDNIQMEEDKKGTCETTTSHDFEMCSCSDFELSCQDNLPNLWILDDNNSTGYLLHAISPMSLLQSHGDEGQRGRAET